MTRGWRHPRYSLAGDGAADEPFGPAWPTLIALVGALAMIGGLLAAVVPSSGLAWPARIAAALGGIVLFRIVRRFAFHRSVAHALTLRAKFLRPVFARPRPDRRPRLRLTVV